MLSASRRQPLLLHVSTVDCRQIWPLMIEAYSVEDAGRSGLVEVCLTAVCEVLGSNRTVGSCVYRKNHSYL